MDPQGCWTHFLVCRFRGRWCGVFAALSWPCIPSSGPNPSLLVCCVAVRSAGGDAAGADDTRHRRPQLNPMTRGLGAVVG